MRKRVRMSYMRLVLPLFVVGLLLCALLLALSGFGIRYAFASPVPLDQLQETGLRTPEVTEALRKTAGTFPVLNEVFEKQFTRLMEGELMDVEAEISLLENTLKMEGGQ